MDVILPPVNTDWFQAELDSICRDQGLSLRIVWAPSQIVARIVGTGGEWRAYKKYPILEGDFVPYVKGWFYKRQSKAGRWKTIAYQKAGELVPANVRMTDMAVVDSERVNPACHIYVIEQKLPDQYARKMWAKKRQLAEMELGMDLFGDFPHEGVWDWWEDIAEHRDNCCERAREARVPRCRGLYREPDGSDLEKVRLAVKLRSERATSDPTSQIEQAAKDIRAGLLEYEKKRKAERMLLAWEIERTARRSIEKPAVYLDPNKRFEETR